MNDFVKRLICLLAVVLFLGGAALPALADSLVNGSIAFNGSPVFDTINIGLATRFTEFNNAKVAVGQQFGDYVTIPDNQAAAFTPFVFVPATIPSSPLWQLTYGGKTYEFFASSMMASYDSQLAIWNIGGNGIARITGFADTEGTWNLTAGQTGASYYFGSAIVVPEPSASALMLLSLSIALGGRWRARQRREK